MVIIMTDTTDIKALREALCKLKSVEGLRTLAAELIDQFEAERQRADYLQRINGIQETTIEVFRHKELAELKGDQVPVGIFAGTDECSEVRHISWLSGASKLQAGDKLFTAPQKPVVLPQATTHSFSGEPFYTKDQILAAIEAAGGIVKDGE